MMAFLPKLTKILVPGRPALRLATNDDLLQCWACPWIPQGRMLHLLHMMAKHSPEMPDGMHPHKNWSAIERARLEHERRSCVDCTCCSLLVGGCEILLSSWPKRPSPRAGEITGHASQFVVGQISFEALFGVIWICLGLGSNKESS